MSKSVEEISKLAGVSITTVRLVINGQAEKYRISQKTRDKVQSLIDEHGYTLNQTARSLKLQKTNTLGLVVPRLSNLFFSDLAEALELQCRKAGYQLITVASDDDEAQEEEVTDNLYSRDIDGLFIATCSHARQKKLLKGRGKKKPILFIDRDFGCDEAVVVASDNEAGSVEMGESLAGMASKFYFLGGDQSFPTMQARLKGLKKGFENKQVTLPESHIRMIGKSTRQHGFEAMEALMQEIGQVPEALITGCLPILEGAMECLKSQRGEIPSDMLVATFDDHTMLDFLPNKVISLGQDTEKLAELSFFKMNSMITGSKVESRFDLVSPYLVNR